MTSSTPPRQPNSTLVKNASPENTALPQIKDPNEEQQSRRSSFNFLRRQRSSESRPHANRSASGGKMSKKQKALAQEELLRQQREAAMLPKQPPRLPSHSPLPQINTFGGEDARPDSLAIVSNRVGEYGQGGSFSRLSGEYKMAPNQAGRVPIPPIPGSSPSNGEFVDPYARTESMTHRGRYSYASSAVSTLNSPRRVRRRKDPTPFK